MLPIAKWVERWGTKTYDIMILLPSCLPTARTVIFVSLLECCVTHSQYHLLILQAGLLDYSKSEIIDSL